MSHDTGPLAVPAGMRGLGAIRRVVDCRVSVGATTRSSAMQNPPFSAELTTSYRCDETKREAKPSGKNVLSANRIGTQRFPGGAYVAAFKLLCAVRKGFSHSRATSQRHFVCTLRRPCAGPCACPWPAAVSRLVPCLVCPASGPRVACLLCFVLLRYRECTSCI